MEGPEENPKKRDREEEDDDGLPRKKDFAAGSADGKLKVKLRIGQKLVKTPAGEGEESPEKKDHVCAECNKRFSSGKALGGHMSSAHVQANRDYSYKRKQLRLAGKGSDDDGGTEEEEEEEGRREYYRGEDGEIRCPHCSKNFPSRKSLFGHMRCHPDRYWRGMEPPSPVQTTNNSKNNKFADEDKDQEINHEPGCVLSWGSKAKRGRSPIKQSSSSSDMELQEAVQHLIYFGNGISVQNPNLEIEKKDENSSGLMGKGKGRADEERSNSEDNMGNSNSEEGGNNMGNCNSEGGDHERWVNSKNIDYSDGGGGLMAKKRRIVEKPMRPLQGSMEFESESAKDAHLILDLQKGDDYSSNSEKFKCSTCNKCFSSHQALGGHRSSHNKFKISIHNAIDECINNAVSGAENNPSYAQTEGEANTENNVNNDANATSKLGAAAGVVHQCSVCNKIFATGKALGGHKKCHSTAQSSLLAASDSLEGSSTPTDDHQPRVLDFDLNEIPDMDQLD